MSSPDSAVVSGIERFAQAFHSEENKPCPCRRGIADYIKTFVFYASKLTNADPAWLFGWEFIGVAEQTKHSPTLI
jgi:hypothetical protein